MNGGGGDGNVEVFDFLDQLVECLGFLILLVLLLLLLLLLLRLLRLVFGLEVEIMFDINCVSLHGLFYGCIKLRGVWFIPFHELRIIGVKVVYNSL